MLNFSKQLGWEPLRYEGFALRMFGPPPFRAGDIARVSRRVLGRSQKRYYLDVLPEKRFKNWDEVFQNRHLGSDTPQFPSSLVTRWTIGGFKAIGSPQNLDLRPITLIFGPNSGGKSSLLHSLLLANEVATHSSFEVDRPHLAQEGLSLGGPSRYLFRRDVENKLTFGAHINGDLPGFPGGGDFEEVIEFSTTKDGRIQQREANWVVRHDNIVFLSSSPQLGFLKCGTSVYINPRSSQFPELLQLLFRRDGARAAKARPQWARSVLLRLWRLHYGGPSDGEVLPSIERNWDVAEGEAALLRFVVSNKMFPKNRYVRWRQEAEDLKDFLGKTCDRFRESFRSFITEMRYVGPIRRFSEWDGTVNPNPARIPISEEAERFDLSYIPDSALAAVNRFLSGPAFPLTPYELRLVSLRHRKSDLRVPPEQVLVLVDLRNRLGVLPGEVGVGLSHLLPVVTSVFANSGTTVLIEQPELHVHPALQADVGDVLIEGALGHNGNTIIAETHSEHLLLRILRRIRETTARATDYPEHLPWIGPGDVAVYYAEPGPNGTTFHPIKISNQGEFETEWPQGFFPERFKELFS